jgi:hypothetical protein
MHDLQPSLVFASFVLQIRTLWGALKVTTNRLKVIARGRNALAYSPSTTATKKRRFVTQAGERFQLRTFNF